MRIAVPRSGRVPAKISRTVAPPSVGARLREGADRLRRFSRALTVAAVVAGLLAGAFLLWLRDLPVVAVERTTVTGLTTPDAPRIRAELERAATQMTTLHVDVERLERAVASYPVVADLHVDADPPHALAIDVVEHRPLAAVPGPGGEPVAIAAGGLLLPSVEVEESLAELPVGEPVTGRRLSGRGAMEALAVLETAEPTLAERVVRVKRSPAAGGLVAVMDQGVELRLGEATDLERKWAAAAAVLGNGELGDAAYLDVSTPARPALGGGGATATSTLDP